MDYSLNMDLNQMFATVAETGRQLGLTQYQINIMIGKRQLEATKVGGRTMVFTEDIERYRKERDQKEAA